PQPAVARSPPLGARDLPRLGEPPRLRGRPPGDDRRSRFAALRKRDDDRELRRLSPGGRRALDRARRRAPDSHAGAAGARGRVAGRASQGTAEEERRQEEEPRVGRWHKAAELTDDSLHCHQLPTTDYGLSIPPMHTTNLREALSVRNLFITVGLGIALVACGSSGGGSGTGGAGGHVATGGSTGTGGAGGHPATGGTTGTGGTSAGTGGTSAGTGGAAGHAGGGAGGAATGGAGGGATGGA